MGEEVGRGKNGREKEYERKETEPRSNFSFEKK
jgi:hypothetical protein